MPYGGFNREIGIYNSQLERKWARWLAHNDCNAIYVGDIRRSHDFLLFVGTPDEIRLEVKPDNNVAWNHNEFVFGAVRRMQKYYDDTDGKIRDALIGVGDPGLYGNFLYVLYTSSRDFIQPVSHASLMIDVSFISPDWSLTLLRAIRSTYYREVWHD